MRFGKSIGYTLLLISILIINVGCNKGPERPALTLDQFNHEAFQIMEVANKLLNEEDVATMNKMADGVEATRAITCDAIGEECNVYYQFLNKIVHLTKDGDLTVNERIELAGLRNKLQSEIKKSELKLKNDWALYTQTLKKDQ